METVDGRLKLRFRFLRYSNSAHVLQDLSGGTGQLMRLVNDYKGRIRRFKVGAFHPLILIVDSDKGSADLFKAVEKKTGRPAPGDQFYFLHDNLYVVPIPIPKGIGEAAIEDLFEPSLLGTEIGGRRFGRTNAEEDGDKYYSKATFAPEVVVKNKGKVIFSGFEPLLKTLVDVIEDYDSKLLSYPAAA